MISISRWEQRLQNYHKALDKLAEVVNISRQRPLTLLERDGLVQRFEFTYELSWKLMKDYAEYQGHADIGGSRDATRKAHEMGLLDDAQVWMEMIRSRNETSHVYDNDKAETVADRVLTVYYPQMLAFYTRMQTLSALSPNDMFA